ncbi:MAG: metallophosphoesterase [Nitrososphaerota archaeon]
MEEKPIYIKENADKVYLIPISDIHMGSKFCDIEKLMGYIDWIKDNKHSYVILIGDVFDVATRESATSPFDQSLPLNDAMEFMSDIIKPIRNRVIGCVDGNHERRLKKFANLDVLQTWCASNNIRYCGSSAVIVFDVKKIRYVFFAHHTTGGGQTIGGKINRVTRLVNIFNGADCYLGGHNHSKALGEDAIYYLDEKDMKIKSRKILYVDCGSFHMYSDSYAESAGLPPSHTGSPRIRMNGSKKDLHISF